MPGHCRVVRVRTVLMANPDRASVRTETTRTAPVVQYSTRAAVAKYIPIEDEQLVCRGKHYRPMLASVRGRVQHAHRAPSIIKVQHYITF